MQIAALNPRFWDKSQVTQDVLDEEKKIMMVQMENDPKMASKPEQVREKIVMGKMNKFYCRELPAAAGVRPKRHVHMTPWSSISLTLPRSWAAPSPSWTPSALRRARASRRSRRTSLRRSPRWSRAKPNTEYRLKKDSRIAAVLFASITMTAEIKIRQRNRLRVWQSQTWGRFRSFARVGSVF